MLSTRASRSPFISLLVAGAFVLGACGASDGGDVVTSPYTHGSSGGGSSSAGSGSSSQGSGNSSSSSSTSNGAASSGGSSSGTPSSSGDTTSSGGATSSSSSSSSGAAVPVTPTYTVAVDNAAPSMDLADTSTVNVTITATEGWAGGAVTLTAASLPSDVTGAFDNATVNVTATTPGTAKFTMTSLSSTVAQATPFTLIGTSGSVTMNAAATITVKAYITIHIPVNADSLTASFGTVNIKAPADIASNPVSVNFVNDDSTPHEIHAENPDQGFAHGQGTFGQGQADTPLRMVTVAGTYAWHLHDDAPPGGPPGGTVVIQ